MFDILGAVLEFTEKHIESKAVLRHVLFGGEDGGHVCVVGLFLATFGVHSGDFRVIWGAKMKLKSILRHLVGPMAPPRGFLRAQGRHFGRFWGYFGFILGTFGVPN